MSWRAFGRNPYLCHPWESLCPGLARHFCHCASLRISRNFRHRFDCRVVYGWLGLSSLRSGLLRGNDRRLSCGFHVISNSVSFRLLHLHIQFMEMIMMFYLTVSTSH
ncbi:hypothetical protein M378DRAFT_464340 [Amanita muscaria Koide BX008]|uniref:Uncharacterized protein n=1 Tax=Amanita muscaria (strain Koide BX008) TaxID=946122 RepID=A0A0C2SR77_AMAMK|nr:hypothetical protein M378DRAFT_464340 [Amanita muscaria Koide BX008]